MGGIDLDKPEGGAGKPGEIDMLADKAAKHLEHPLDGLVQVHEFGGDRLLSGEGQELLSKVGGPFGGPLNLFQVTREGFGRVGLGQCQIREA